MSIRVRVRKRPDRDSFQLYYTDEFTGRRVTRASSATTQREAERAALLWEEELAKSAPTIDPSWDSFRVRFEDEHLAHKSPRTRNSYTTALNRFEQLIGKPKRISQITASVMSQFSAELRTRKMATATACAILRHVKSALSWAAKIGLIASAPAVLMPSRAGQRQMHGRPLSDAEFAKLLDAVDHVAECQPHPEAWRFALRGLWLSGLRLQEARRLSWSDGPIRIDLIGGKHPQMIFQAAGQKSRKAEVVPLTPDFAELLGSVPTTNRHGRVLQLPFRAGRIISKIGQASGVVVNDDGKFASAHDLRRSFGTRWSTRVMPVVLRKLMRHRDVKTTLDYYADQHVNDIGDAVWKFAAVHAPVHDSTSLAQSQK